MAATPDPITGIFTALFPFLGGLYGSSQSEKAAQTQADAAKYAANLQAVATDRALQLQYQQWLQQQQNIAPWLNTGTSGLYRLADLLGISTQRFQPAPATPPTAGTANGTGGQTGGQTGDTVPIQGSLVPGASALPFPSFESWLEQGPYKDFPSLRNSPDSLAGLQRAYDQIKAQYEADQVTQRISGYGAAPGSTGGYAPTPAGTWTDNPHSDQFGSLVTPFKFDTADLYKDPGYQFRLKEGLRAIQNSAAARGGALGGNTIRAVNDYSQGSAAQEYSDAYTRAFNEFQTDQANTFNRLASLAGIGQQATTLLNNSGTNFANNAGSLLTGGAQSAGEYATQGANARASGYVGGANAITGGVQSGLQNFINYMSGNSSQRGR